VLPGFVQLLRVGEGVYLQRADGSWLHYASEADLEPPLYAGALRAAYGLAAGSQAAQIGVGVGEDGACVGIVRCQSTAMDEARAKATACRPSGDARWPGGGLVAFGGGPVCGAVGSVRPGGRTVYRPVGGAFASTTLKQRFSSGQPAGVIPAGWLALRLRLEWAGRSVGRRRG
jgi:hypothetical protein